MQDQDPKHDAQATDAGSGGSTRSSRAREERDRKDAWLKIDFSKVVPRYGKEEKERIFLENRAKLVEDLWTERLVFESRPYMVDLQLSNFCNMSCTMCYDGVNPPLKKMPEALVEKAAEQILPKASVIVPFSGSEPLILTWDLTRKLAIEYGIELDIVTNLQYLDEQRFEELEPHVSMISFSIDSHIPEVYEAIRLRSKPELVFRNLPIAARLCKEHGIDVLVKAVFMVENAPWMDETVAFMADQGIETVHILRYLHFIEARQFSDPLLHMSKEWVAWMREKVRRVAEDKKIRVIWDVEGHQNYDYRIDPPEYRATKLRDPWLWRLNRSLPGYCAQSVYRVKVDSDGLVYPCCVVDDGNLSLGDLNLQDFDQIWNGVEAQDLRRGMMTGDVPTACRGCGFFTDRIPPEAHLPFIERVNDALHHTGPREDLELLAPEHMTRTETRPTLRWTAPADDFDEYWVVLALGGEAHDIHRFKVSRDRTEAEIPEDTWAAMRPNFGYWWGVWAVNHEDHEKSHRVARVRCLTRHKPMERLEGSTLRY
ncbi:MAG: radical SAM protein [Planctomycetota bacterium]